EFRLRRPVRSGSCCCPTRVQKGAASERKISRVTEAHLVEVAVRAERVGRTRRWGTRGGFACTDRSVRGRKYCSRPDVPTVLVDTFPVLSVRDWQVVPRGWRGVTWSSICVD